MSSGPKLWAIRLAASLASIFDSVAIPAGAPTLLSPTEGFIDPVNPVTGRAYNVGFTWERPAATASIYQYDLQISLDSAGVLLIFEQPVGSTSPTVGMVVGPTSFWAVDFMPGYTYYWRARSIAPALSLWSEMRSFTVQSLPPSVPPGTPTPEVRVITQANTWVPEDYYITIPVDIRNVEKFDACSYQISFDPAVLRADNVTAGEINGIPIPVTAWSESVPGTLTIVQNVSDTLGVSGSGHLAMLRFQATGTRGTSSYINLKNGIMSNNLGEPIPAYWVGGSVYISYLMMGDANGDGQVNALDITKVERFIAGLDAPEEPPEIPIAPSSAVELQNIQTAVISMMVDNNLSILPHPVVTATRDMHSFPDDTSVGGTTDKLLDPLGVAYTASDSKGYVLHQHDVTGGGNNSSLVNYVATRYTMGTYTVDAGGTVTQQSY